MRPFFQTLSLSIFALLCGVFAALVAIVQPFHLRPFLGSTLDGLAFLAVLALPYLLARRVSLLALTLLGVAAGMTLFMLNKG